MNKNRNIVEHLLFYVLVKHSSYKRENQQRYSELSYDC